MSIVTTLRSFAALPGHVSGNRLNSLRGKAVILMYHRILPVEIAKKYYIQPGMYVCNDVFANQLQYLRQHFKILSLTDLVRQWKEKRWNQADRLCSITFDDGWLDNYRYAFPILRSAGLPATIFLPTALIGTLHWFWPDTLGFLLSRISRSRLSQAQRKELELFPMGTRFGLKEFIKSATTIEAVIEQCKKMDQVDINTLITRLYIILDMEQPKERVLLNWREIAEMTRHRITFGSHSCSHRILTRLDLDQAENEITQSLQTLIKKKINLCPVFCYPNGNYNQDIIAILKAAGYKAAVATKPGFEKQEPSDLYALKRIGIHNDMTSTLPLFTRRLSLNA